MALSQITPPSARQDSIVFKNDTDSIITDIDTKKVKRIKSKAKAYIPRKAGLYSAILPGLGQAYNKKYWKMPIVYGGFIGLGLVIDFYNSEYKRFKTNLFAEIDDDPNTVNNTRASADRLRSLIDKSRRERDFYIIMAGVLYLLNIADAHIDAHLKEFDLNEDLKVSIDPKVSQNSFGNLNAGLSVKLRF